jgi:hypothetical protein
MTDKFKERNWTQNQSEWADEDGWSVPNCTRMQCRTSVRCLKTCTGKLPADWWTAVCASSKKLCRKQTSLLSCVGNKGGKWVVWKCRNVKYFGDDTNKPNLRTGSVRHAVHTAGFSASVGTGTVGVLVELSLVNSQWVMWMTTAMKTPFTGKALRNWALYRLTKAGSSFLSIAPRFPKNIGSLEGFQASPVCSSGKSNM